MLLDNWSRGELLQLGGIVVAAIAIVVGIVLRKEIRQIHIMINSRLTQLIAGAEAVGQVKERAEADAREVVQDERTDAAGKKEL